jgi:excisionase family DNA binding protein
MSLINFPERQPADPAPELTPADLLTPIEAAKLLRIGRSSVYKLMRTRELGSLTIGRKRFTTREMVERYKAMRLRASLPPGAKR